MVSEMREWISPEVIRRVDEALDARCSGLYHDQPLAQDWARVCKLAEETGEAVSELILWTGQNPRKGTDLEARSRMLAELADVALGAIYAVQHFTKDVEATRQVITDAQRKHETRFHLPAEDSGQPQEA